MIQILIRMTPDVFRSYIRFLAQKKNYQKAWQEVLNGNPEAYGHQLKLARYYTADEAAYTKGAVSLCKEFKGKFPSILTDVETPPETNC
jgi:hypothetical protein